MQWIDNPDSLNTFRPLGKRRLVAAAAWVEITHELLVVSATNPFERTGTKNSQHGYYINFLLWYMQIPAAYLNAWTFAGYEDG
ncbi:hypothetical protein ANO14919_019980 [Xylariales sp. No.14919]|nr:hypothetical protein ANO14919_019980 [Xylariales sp. No.14919]